MKGSKRFTLCNLYGNTANHGVSYTITPNFHGIRYVMPVSDSQVLYLT